MKVHENYLLTNNTQPSFRSKVHIIDGFLHADNMEHFAKAALKNAGKVSDIKMHYVNCNNKDINTKQMSEIESTLKSLAGSVKNDDFVVIPGLASVPILNLSDRIENVLGKSVYLTVRNLKSYKNLLLNFLKEIYDYKYYHKNEIKEFDKDGQELEYTYGVIKEINKLKNMGVKVYLPAGHGADETIKWLAKQRQLKNELYKYIATGRDSDGHIKNILRSAQHNNYYDFNLLSLSDANIVNIKNKNGSNFVFSAQDDFVNDNARGVYNFTPVRNSSGRILGYSYHDESTVEYPYDEFKANNQIYNLCKYVGLPRSDFYSSYNEDKIFKEYLRKGYSTSNLADKLYSLKDVYDSREIKNRGLDTLGTLVNKDGLIFDTNSSGKVIFQKTNCEGSGRPSVLSMWGSCFSAINAMVRDIKKSSTFFSNPWSSGSSNYISKADKKKACGEYSMAEYYYNEALKELHPNRTSLNYKENAIEVYEKLYSVLKLNHKYTEAKGVANMIINLTSNDIKDLSVYDSTYIKKQSKIGDYYKDLAEYCRMECEYYPARVCEWAAKELEKSSSYGDKIVIRRAEQNQYIGDLYDECH